MISHAFATLAFAVLLLPGAASAGSTATRCDTRGCTHIHCNSTGERCYRYEDLHARAGPRNRAGCAEIAARAGKATRRLCDSDGDRCYSSQARRWNYREYYRRHGYCWDN